MSCDRKIGPYDCCSVVQGDCLELMKYLPDGCVDAVITDPPFSDTTHTNAKSNRNGGSGIKAIDFKAIDSLLSLLAPVCSGWIVANMDWRHICELEFHPNESFELVRFGVWVKTNPMPQISADRPANGWDGIAYLFPRGKTKRWSGGGCHGNWIGPVVTDGLHPTGKPLEMLELWVERFTEEGQTILDPFCGSGTTLVAAKKLGRHYLGFEISEEYCRISRERLARIDAQPTLFEPKPEQLSL